MTEPLRITFDVACPAAHAFQVWTTRIGSWWPPDHTVSGHPAEVVLQSGVGGRIYEKTPDGTEHEWGEVTVWQPPTRLAYLWYLGRDKTDATEVEISFQPQGTEQTGTKDDPWALKTPPGTSGYTMYRDDDVLVCQVGSTTLKYQFRAVDDLRDWLARQGDWVPLGAADESKPAADGTVEAFGRAADNPVGGWYGLRKGYRGRFGMYLPPLLEALGLAELTHDARNNKIRAI